MIKMAVGFLLDFLARFLDLANSDEIFELKMRLLHVEGVLFGKENLYVRVH